MKSLGIYYFSGTGNTKRVSDLLKKQLEARGNQVTLIPMEEPLSTGMKLDLNGFHMLGLGYPIHGYGTPAIVTDFLKLLPQGETLPSFVFKTAGDYNPLNDNASTKLIRALEKKGYPVFYDRTIVMPSNWIIEFENSLIKRIYRCAQEKIRHMCEEILEGIPRRYDTRGIPRMLSFMLAHMEKKYGSPYFGKSLRIKESCNLCALCSKECPVGNIQQEGNRVVFKDKCIWCMRCIYRCPKAAIESKGFSFCILKGGYNLDKALRDETKEDLPLPRDDRGIYKRLSKYFDRVEL